MVTRKSKPLIRHVAFIGYGFQVENPPSETTTGHTDIMVFSNPKKNGVVNSHISPVSPYARAFNISLKNERFPNDMQKHNHNPQIN